VTARDWRTSRSARAPIQPPVPLCRRHRRQPRPIPRRHGLSRAGTQDRPRNALRRHDDRAGRRHLVHLPRRATRRRDAARRPPDPGPLYPLQTRVLFEGLPGALPAVHDRADRTEAGRLIALGVRRGRRRLA
jgi:hypothetical protein